MARLPIHMPKFGLTMEEGTIVEWKAGVGSEVKQGDILLCVETEKVVSDIEAPADGTVVEVIHGVDAEVPVGEVVAYLEEN